MSNWYEEMANAMRRREVAINGVKRWEGKVAEAEAEIANLASHQPATVVAVSELADVIAPDYADSAE